MDPLSKPQDGCYSYFEPQTVNLNLIENSYLFERNGEFEMTEYKWIEISDIQCRESRKPQSLAYAIKQIDKSEALEPVHLSTPESTEEYKYTDTREDPIINALKEKGFTRVLALVSRIQKCRPILPQDAAEHYEELKKMFIDQDATGSLRADINRGNVWIDHQIPAGINILTFSILREGVNAINVSRLPPDSELKVQVVDNRIDSDQLVLITGKIFGTPVEKRGTIKFVTQYIFQLCRDKGMDLGL